MFSFMAHIYKTDNVLISTIVHSNCYIYEHLHTSSVYRVLLHVKKMFLTPIFSLYTVE